MNKNIAKSIALQGEIGEESIDRLIELTHDPHANTRFWALDGLERCGSRAGRSVNRLIDMLDEPPLKVRLWAVRTLGNMGTDGLPAVPRLLSLLRERSRNEKKLSLYVESALDGLIPYIVWLPDDSPLIRAIVDDLAVGLDDPRERVRYVCSSGLGMSILNGHTNHLIRRVLDCFETEQDQHVRNCLQSILRFMEPDDVDIAMMAQLLDHADPDVQYLAINLMGSFKSRARRFLPRLAQFANVPKLADCATRAMNAIENSDKLN